MLEKCTELLAAVPEGWKEAIYLECIAAQGGLGVPLNIFLMQEVQRLQLVIVNVGGMLKVSGLHHLATPSVVFQHPSSHPSPTRLFDNEHE